MRLKRELVFLALSGLLFQGCASYNRHTSDFVSSEVNWKSKIQKKMAESSMYDVIPRHRSQLKGYDSRWLTWGAFGNDDSGIFGEFEDKPYFETPSFGNACRWYIRNPAHNLSFYVLGSAWREKHSNFAVFDLDSAGESNVLEKNNGKVFGKGRWCFYFGFNDYKPFISSRLGFFEWYAGWRERGNLGWLSVRKSHAEKKK